jgi:hypothetical protein
MFPSALHVTYPAHLFQHDLNALVIFREVRKLCPITVACRTCFDGSNTGIPGYIPIRNMVVSKRSWERLYPFAAFVKIVQAFRLYAYRHRESLNGCL